MKAQRLLAIAVLGSILAMGLAGCRGQTSSQPQGPTPNLGTTPVSGGATPGIASTPDRSCVSDFCAPGLPGPLTAWPGTDRNHLLRLAPANIQLVNLDGSVVWTIPFGSTLIPDLVAAGDFTGDGVPDFIFDEVRPASPPATCAGQSMSQTQLVFVDGRTGATWRPIEAALDVCWASYGYATHQWAVGSAYIGHFRPDLSGNQVVVFPYYATSGRVLSYDARRGWRYLQGTSIDLAYPSTPAFDAAYDASNPTPCSEVTGRSSCWITDSHVANAIFITAGSKPLGLMVLTSHRAVIYRPDFTPTSDVVWSYPEGTGRNYGLVEAHGSGLGKTATLIGGCSVAKTRDTMHTGQLSGDPCGLEHHYEWFSIQGQAIVQHSSHYYGWYMNQGYWQDRLEFPFPSSVAITGDKLWSVFNLYRDGQWQVEMLPDPADPDHPIETPGWYVWGAVVDGAGQVLLAATRTRSTPGTAVESYIPPWEFDFLRWQNGGLVSVSHQAGVVPSLALYPPGPDYHVSDGDTFGLVVRKSPTKGLQELLVETADGTESYVGLP